MHDVFVVLLALTITGAGAQAQVANANTQILPIGCDYGDASCSNGTVCRPSNHTAARLCLAEPTRDTFNGVTFDALAAGKKALNMTIVFELHGAWRSLTPEDQLARLRLGVLAKASLLRPDQFVVYAKRTELYNSTGNASLTTILDYGGDVSGAPRWGDFKMPLWMNEDRQWGEEDILRGEVGRDAERGTPEFEGPMTQVFTRVLVVAETEGDAQSIGSDLQSSTQGERARPHSVRFSVYIDSPPEEMRGTHDVGLFVIAFIVVGFFLCMCLVPRCFRRCFRKEPRKLRPKAGFDIKQQLLTDMMPFTPPAQHTEESISSGGSEAHPLALGLATPASTLLGKAHSKPLGLIGVPRADSIGADSVVSV
eukprot:TRINITY_DN2798_c0_g1_i1.p1 TRINITY_DN2798_c0_g1~~TRINITY_DN2798_c0_g1_i1.p1  ORF type:complete len:367 (+),score=35.00 TRINITY_DN2798_c0_g1_i1:63-1163(+)